MNKSYNFNKQLNKIFSFDIIRLFKIVEMFKYTFIYFTLIVIITFFINRFYYNKKHINSDNEDKENTTENDSHDSEDKKIFSVNFLNLFFKTLLETFFIVLLIFYCKKIVVLAPSLSNFYYKKFIPNTTLEYSTHIALIVVLIEMLPGYKHNLEEIHSYF